MTTMPRSIDSTTASVTRGPAVNDWIARMPAYQPGLNVEAEGQYAVYLCNNENPFGESRLRKLGKQLLEHCNIARYPDNHYPALRSALSRLHSIDENQLLIGNGSSEILMFLARAFLSRGRTALCSEYSFSFYSIASSMTGAEIRFVPSKYYGHDVDALLEAAADAQVIFLDNPCNPTGRYLNEVTMRSLLQHIPESTLLVVDEAYVEYATSPDFKSCIGFVNQYPNLVVVRTLSKAYGLAGLRLGYGISNPMLIGQLERARPPFNINALTAELARMALEDADFIAACRSHNAAERKRCQQHVENDPAAAHWI
ncbi:pyridoxal phosphate-dependent aminotransferase [Burkholderia singularis]|uniref:pyridoxal phosphate-dependent aminotransferase n=2 Tax=Burkholderia TaxID=32008 RepID=UPI0009F6F28F|nr:histidinol-phosphate transaminase [Burkholderia sp. Bp7605]